MQMMAYKWIKSRRILSLLICCILIVALANILNSPLLRHSLLDETKYDDNQLPYTYPPRLELVEVRKSTTKDIRQIRPFPVTEHGHPKFNHNPVKDTERARMDLSHLDNYTHNRADLIDSIRQRETTGDVSISSYVLGHTSANNDFIVHILMDENNNRFTIDSFLSVWSVVKYIRPVKVMFHCRVMPSNAPWWRRTLRITPHTEVVLHNQAVKYNTTLNNDMWSFEILKRYGGMVVTPNVIFLKKISNLQNIDLLIDKSFLPGSVLYRRNNTNILRVLDEMYSFIASTRTFDTRKIRKQHGISLHILEESDIYCMSNISVSRKDSVISNKTLVKLCQSYSAYIKPITLDQMAKETTQWAAIGRFTLFGSRDPLHTVVPNTYHYLWTEDRVRDLDFMEMLSIKSLHHFAKPEKIYFHSFVLPSGKRWDDISEMPSFSFRPANWSNTTECITKANILRKEGGIFVDFNIIVTEDISFYRLGYEYFHTKTLNNPVIVNYHQYMIHDEVLQNDTQCPSVLMSSSEITMKPPTYTVVYPLVLTNVDHYNITTLLSEYTFIQIPNRNDLNLMALSSLRGRVGDIARFVLKGEPNTYGNETVFKIPNIIHYIWFGNDTDFCFHSFLCVYSASINQKPEKIYFHYENLPRGQWWRTLSNAVTLTLVQTAPPTSVFGQPVKIVEHQADVARLRILQKYGGIYLDIDMFVINSLNPLRTHSFVMAEEQDCTLGNGLIMAEKDSEFLNLYINSYRDFNDSLWGYNSVVVPYKLMMKNRNLIHLAPSDRILKPDWSTCLNDIWYPESKYYWRDNYVLHLYCKGNVDKYLPFMANLIYSDQFATSTFGKIARNLYDHFKQMIKRASDDKYSTSSNNENN